MIYILTLIMSFFISTMSFSKDQVILKADEWCPYNCSPENKNNQGLLVDIVTEALKEIDIEVIYETYPWTRALKETDEALIDGVIGASISDLKNSYYTKTPLVSGANCFFVNNDSSWSYKSLSDLENIKLGGIQDYSYGDQLDSYIKNNPKKVDLLFGSNTTILNNFKKLQSNRIDVLIEDKNVVFFNSKKYNINFKLAGCEKELDLYIVFSKKHPKAKLMVETLEKWMQKNKKGKVLDIYKKYGLNY